jgi:hypothetical protein
MIRNKFRFIMFRGMTRNGIPQAFCFAKKEEFLRKSRLFRRLVSSGFVFREKIFCSKLENLQIHNYTAHNTIACFLITTASYISGLSSVVHVFINAKKRYIFYFQKILILCNSPSHMKCTSKK